MLKAATGVGEIKRVGGSKDIGAEGRTRLRVPKQSRCIYVRRDGPSLARVVNPIHKTKRGHGRPLVWWNRVQKRTNAVTGKGHVQAEVSPL